MVAHPEKYVKYDVSFREGAACFKQAFALPFRAASLRVALGYKSLRERMDKVAHPLEKVKLASQKYFD